MCATGVPEPGAAVCDARDDRRDQAGEAGQYILVRESEDHHVDQRADAAGLRAGRDTD